MTLYEKIGLAVRRARINARMSQDELALRCQLVRSSITNLEAGRQRVTIETLYVIADALHVTPLSLFPGRSELGEYAVLMPLSAEAKEQMTAWLASERSQLLWLREELESKLRSMVGRLVSESTRLAVDPSYVPNALGILQQNGTEIDRLCGLVDYQTRLVDELTRKIEMIALVDRQPLLEGDENHA